MKPFEGIRLANPVKCGKKEDTSFYAHEADCELVAIKVPVVNGEPGEFTTQVIIKMTSKTPEKKVAYTSLMNTMWWTWSEDALEKPLELKSKPTRKR